MKGIKNILLIFVPLLFVILINTFFVYYNSQQDSRESKYVETIIKEHKEKMQENYKYLMTELDKYVIDGSESKEELKSMLLDLKTLGTKSESMTLPTKEASDAYIALYKQRKTELEKAINS